MRLRMIDSGRLLLVLVVAFFAWAAFLMEPIGYGQSYNETAIVNTTVNITNSAPFVQDVAIPQVIDLIAYGNLTVYCNVTVYDYDNNTDSVNASLYYQGTSPLDTLDRNTNYFNSSCSRTSPSDFYTNFSCSFDVAYFANNGTWYCNATAVDLGDGVGTNVSDPATVNPLIAIKMTEIIDFGDLAVNDVSDEKTANITNAGNRDINISVEGYGDTPGDNLAMVCDSGNIPVGFEKYDIAIGTPYASMTALTGSSLMIDSMTIGRQTDDALESLNTTYWLLQVPPGAGGVCNGKILFTASDRGN